MRYILIILLLFSVESTAAGRIGIGIAYFDKGSAEPEITGLENPIGELIAEYDLFKSGMGRITANYHHISGVYSSEFGNGLNAVGFRFYLEFK